MIFPQRSLEKLGRDLLRRMAGGVRAARGRGRPVLASLTLPLPAGIDPRAPASAAQRRGERHFLWSRRAPSPLVLAAMGAAVSVRVDASGLSVRDAGGREISLGPVPRGRFSAAERARAWAIEGALGDRAAGRREPRFVGGFAFSPRGRRAGAFPAALLWIPRVQIVRDARGTRLTLCCLTRHDDDPAALAEDLLVHLDAANKPFFANGSEAGGVLRLSADPPPAAWLASAERARRLIGSGDFEKIVLARRCRVEGARPFDPIALHARLASQFPSCFAFALGEGDDALVGATPELLVRRTGRLLRSGSLAGSIARGQTPTDDRRLARALLESKKEQAEHEIVLRAIREALAPRCRTLDVPATPRIVRLSNIQHLYTPVTGTLHSPEPLLSLVAALHPTPAVGGHPRASALRAIHALEPFDRGWYAGPVGWIDAAGDGEFAVAIRSARIQAAHATLCAGAGIVQASDPKAELGEVQTKLQALLDALEGAP